MHVALAPPRLLRLAGPVLRRFVGGAALALWALGWGTVAAEAGTPAASHHAPRVYQMNPTKVDLRRQTNVMLLGQNLTPATRVKVGTQQASTMEAPDGFHLLVKLPPDLDSGTYIVEVSNEAGSTTAAEPLLVDRTDPGLNRMTMLVGGGSLALLGLMMRLARTPTLG